MTLTEKRLKGKIDRLIEELRQRNNAISVLEKDNQTLRETIRGLRDQENYQAGRRAWTN